MAYRLARLGWSARQIGERLNDARGVVREVNAQRKQEKKPPITGAWKRLTGPARRARAYVAEGKRILEATPVAFQRLDAKDVAFQRSVVDVHGKRLTRERQIGRPRLWLPIVLPSGGQVYCHIYCQSVGHLRAFRALATSALRARSRMECGDL